MGLVVDHLNHFMFAIFPSGHSLLQQDNATSYVLVPRTLGRLPNSLLVAALTIEHVSDILLTLLNSLQLHPIRTTQLLTTLEHVWIIHFSDTSTLQTLCQVEQLPLFRQRELTVTNFFLALQFISLMKTTIFKKNMKIFFHDKNISFFSALVDTLSILIFSDVLILWKKQLQIDCLMHSRD